MAFVLSLSASLSWTWCCSSSPCSCWMSVSSSATRPSHSPSRFSRRQRKSCFSCSKCCRKRSGTRLDIIAVVPTSMKTYVYIAHGILDGLSQFGLGLGKGGPSSLENDDRTGCQVKSSFSFYRNRNVLLVIIWIVRKGDDKFSFRFLLSGFELDT